MTGRQEKRHLRALALVLGLATAPAPAFAHADILERIAGVNQELAARPDDAALYLKRGELHRLHRDWPAALADYARARRLDPDSPQIDYYSGRLWLEAGRPDLAREALDRFLARRPGHADALINRSRALGQLGERVAAADDMGRAMAALDEPTPELYLERARLLVAAGEGHVDEGLAVLDQGIARLGPVVTLIQLALEVDTGRGHHDAALRRLDALPEAIRSLPLWRARRGDVLRAAGRDDEARTAYAAALAALQELPPRRRAVRASAELETHIREALKALSGG